jgi:hypothetical protein
VIDVDDESLVFSSSMEPVVSSCMPEFVAKQPKHEIKESTVFRDVSEFGVPSCASGEESEPDGEPGIEGNCADDVLDPCQLTQPDSEPETDSAPVTSTGDEVLGSTGAAQKTVLCQALIDTASNLQAFDETVGAREVSEKLIDCARRNDLDTASKELEKLEDHVSDKWEHAHQQMLFAAPNKVLERAREVGRSVGRALAHIAHGASAGSSQCVGLALAAELREFATFAAGINPTEPRTAADWSSNGLGACSLRGRTLQVLGNVTEVATEVWSLRGGFDKYVCHLQQVGRVKRVDEALCGSAAWQRMLAELKAAILVAEPSGAEGDDCSALTGKVGHRRMCYVAARVAWALECQARDALVWMKDLAAGAGETFDSRSPSTEFARVHEQLQECPVVRDLLHSALRDAAAQASAHLLTRLQDVLKSIDVHRPRTAVAVTEEGLPATSKKPDKASRKEYLAARFVDLSEQALVDFRKRWLDGEIEGMGLGRRHREAVDRRHQALRHTASRSETALRMLRQVVTELRA